MTTNVSLPHDDASEYIKRLVSQVGTMVKESLWIHGHTHDNRDYEVNGTRVICNPRGYVTSRAAENSAFNPSLVIELVAATQSVTVLK